MANNNLATIPELWAREALILLTETTSSVGSVNRQFDNEVRNYGETVHAHRVNTRKIRRKTDADDFEDNDANTSDVLVKLDQWLYDSCTIKDGEMSKSQEQLIQDHLVPMVQTIGRGIDRAILGRCHAFMQQGDPTKRAGKLRGMTAANCYEYLLEAQQILDMNNAPDEGRTGFFHPTARTKLQLNELFVSADKRGDGGAALRSGLIGQIADIDVRKGQNVNYRDILNADIQLTTTTEPQVAGFAGQHTIADPGTNPTVGEFFVFEENGQPTYVTATSAGTDVTLNEALKYAIADNSAATHYLKGTNAAVERAAGYAKEMVITHTASKYLTNGQLIAFGTGGSRHTYTIIEATIVDSTHTSILLDRPLDATVASGANVFPGPAGSINPVFHRDALSFVSRPLIAPIAGAGALSYVEFFNGMSIRVTMQYDATKGGHKVNVDMLGGVAVLNDKLLIPVLG